MATKKSDSKVSAFVSYSHRDEKFRASLETHLAILKRNGLLAIWHDRRIDPGETLDTEIDSHLRSARIVLLLVSPDFIASDYCYSTELRLAMELHATGRAQVVPVILRPVDWGDAPFSNLLALPTDGKPISLWRNRDEAYLNVAKGIRKLLEELPRNSQEGRTTSMPVTLTVDAYQGSVVQIGGTGSRVVTKRAWLTSEHAYLPADDYVTHSFNGPGDVMWVHCPDEFEIVGATSPTGNDVFPMVKSDSRFPHGVLLKEHMKNSIVITRERRRE